MITRRRLSLILLSFGLGIASYIFAVLSTFSLESSSSNLNLFTMFLYTLVGGLIALPFGYGSVILIGGEMSLKITEFIAHLTRSRHVIEVIPEEQRQSKHRITRYNLLFFFPTLIFLLSVIISWNIHNLHDPRTLMFHDLLPAMFHDLLHALDVFSKPLQENLVTYSVSVIPYMLILVFVAGLVPSMVLPYFRRFKITGVNSGPFHTNILFATVGFIAGLGAILTLIGLIYEVLWVGRGPNYYHYVLPAMLGFSIHYSLGAFLGRDRAEDTVERILLAGSGKRVIQGTVNIQVVLGDDKEKSQ